MTIQKARFGTTRAGEPITCWVLRNQNGMSAEVLSYGGILRALTVPAPGGPRDVVLGFDDVAGYEGQDTYIGALVGRVANRIGGARFTLDGKAYPLPTNSGPNCLHGGDHGFHEKVWQGEVAGEALVLTYTSPAGEEGFPGALTAQVTYVLTPDNALELTYTATCDAPTPVNLTNHSYFNLKGAGAATIGDHTLQIVSAAITEIDDTGAPTGRLLDVAGTPFDLRQPQPLDLGLASRHPQILLGGGYDHNYVLTPGQRGSPALAAIATCQGLRMECHTTQPGVQLYTGNYLTGALGKGGLPYPRRCAFCLETQNWPDAVNQPSFPSPVLRPGEEYRHTTRYRFSAQ